MAAALRRQRKKRLPSGACPAHGVRGERFAPVCPGVVSRDGKPRPEVGTRADFARALCRYWHGNLCDRDELRACAIAAADGRKYQDGFTCACRLLLLRGATAHRSDVLQRKTQCGFARKKARATGSQRRTELAGKWHRLKLSRNRW